MTTPLVTVPALPLIEPVIVALNVFVPVIVSVPAKCTNVLSATVAAVPRPKLVLAVDAETKSDKLFAFNNEVDNVVTAAAAEFAADVADAAAFVSDVAAAAAELLAFVAEVDAADAELSALVAEVDASLALVVAIPA